MSANEKLLPCPFCGGEAKLHPPTRGYRAWVDCTGCEAIHPDLPSVSYPKDSVREAMECWNTRAATSSEPQHPLKELAEAQAPMPNDMAQLLANNAWDLYALSRYQVVPTQFGFWGYAVVVGDSPIHVYKGHKRNCDLVARRMMGAFLDGAFLAASADAATAPEPQQAVEAPDNPTMTRSELVAAAESIGMRFPAPLQASLDERAGLIVEGNIFEYSLRPASAPPAAQPEGRSPSAPVAWQERHRGGKWRSNLTSKYAEVASTSMGGHFGCCIYLDANDSTLNTSPCHDGFTILEFPEYAEGWEVIASGIGRCTLTIALYKLKRWSGEKGNV